MIAGDDLAYAPTLKADSFGNSRSGGNQGATLGGAHARVCQLADLTPMLPLDQERSLLQAYVDAQQFQAHILASVGYPIVNALGESLTLLTPAALMSTDTESTNNLGNSRKVAPVGGKPPSQRQSTFIETWWKDTVIARGHDLKKANTVNERARCIKALAEGVLSYDYSLILQFGDRFTMRPLSASWDGADMAETAERLQSYKDSVRTSLKIRDTLYRSNIRIVLQMTEDLRRTMPHLEDEVISWGCYGLWSSIDRYGLGYNEGGGNTRLYTYATNRIQFYLHRFLQNSRSDIRASTGHQQQRSKIRRAASELHIEVSNDLEQGELDALSQKTSLPVDVIRNNIRSEIRVESFSNLALAAGTDIYEPPARYDERHDDNASLMADGIDRSSLGMVLRQVRDMDAIEQFALAMKFGCGNAAEAALAVYEHRRAKLRCKLTAIMTAPAARKQLLSIRTQRMG